jgi:hypothetical protein
VATLKKPAEKMPLIPLLLFRLTLRPCLLFYSSNKFPKKYQDGAFIAFHAKSAELQKGYLVGFVPFKNGKPSDNGKFLLTVFLPATININLVA